MSTVQDIITAALGKNRKNTSGIIATPTELLNAFRRIYPVFWTIGARVNPGFFGTSEELEANAESGPDGWFRPSDAELVFLIKDADGDEIAIVPLDELDADPYTPAVYEWGQEYFPAGNADDPGLSETLTAWYAKQPDEITAASDELEALWPTNFDELLVLELAMYLAAKDERTAELQMLRPDRDVWLRRFVAHLEHHTLPLRRSTGTAQRFTADSWLPLNQLLTGGTEVSL